MTINLTIVRGCWLDLQNWMTFLEVQYVNRQRNWQRFRYFLIGNVLCTWIHSYATCWQLQILSSVLTYRYLELLILMRQTILGIFLHTSAPIMCTWSRWIASQINPNCWIYWWVREIFELQTYNKFRGLLRRVIPVNDNFSFSFRRSFSRFAKGNVSLCSSGLVLSARSQAYMVYLIRSCKQLEYICNTFNPWVEVLLPKFGMSF